MSKEKVTFDEALKRFVKHTALSMKYAEMCAQMALQHFHDHGQVARLQQFFDAMPENWVRKAAFKLWLRDHAPITMVDGKFLKDVSEDANEFNLAQAFAKPFWEFAPDPEDVYFGRSDLVSDIEKLIKKREGKRQFADDDDAKAALAQVKSFHDTLIKQSDNSAANTDNEEIPDDETEQPQIATA